MQHAIKVLTTMEKMARNQRVDYTRQSQQSRNHTCPCSHATGVWDACPCLLQSCAAQECWCGTDSHPTTRAAANFNPMDGYGHTALDKDTTECPTNHTTKPTANYTTALSALNAHAVQSVHQLCAPPPPPEP